MNRRYSIYLLIGIICLLLVIVFRGSNLGGQSSVLEGAVDSVTLKYAKNLEIKQYKQYTVVRMRDPWNTEKTLKTYVLVDRNDASAQEPTRSELAAIGENPLVVKIPLQRAILATSCHAYLVDAMNALSLVAGVCDAQYMNIPHLKTQLDLRKIKDVGNGMSPNIEMIIDAHADALFLSPFQNTNHGELEKLNIPIIECADYMEVSPLARAEWMKFYGLLFGRWGKTEALFTQVEENYQRLKAAVKKEKPVTVFVDKLYGNIWYQPNGHSTVGTLLKDAGGNFLFNYLEGTGSTGLTVETVLDKAQDADFWLIKYGQNSDLSYDELQQEHPLYARFKAFEERHVWGTNVDKVDILQESPFHPDYYLEDCIRILHPGVLPEGEMHYFKPLK
jgi:iron complex transport system substrate-binding protein